jgi:hypothetical protein
VVDKGVAIDEGIYVGHGFFSEPVTVEGVVVVSTIRVDIEVFLPIESLGGYYYLIVIFSQVESCCADIGSGRQVFDSDEGDFIVFDFIESLKGFFGDIQGGVYGDHRFIIVVVEVFEVFGIDITVDEEQAIGVCCPVRIELFKLGFSAVEVISDGYPYHFRDRSYITFEHFSSL